MHIEYVNLRYDILLLLLLVKNQNSTWNQLHWFLIPTSYNTNSCPFLVFCHRALNKRINYFEQLLAAVSEQRADGDLTLDHY